MSVTTRTIELDGLAADLAHAVEQIVAEEKKVVARGSLNIKRDWRDGWNHLGTHLPKLGYTVGYDVDVRGTTITGTTGPDKKKGQGALGNIIEFADGSIRSAPHPAGAHALDAEEPRFVDAVLDAAAKLLEPR
jgi:hypothetical protein